jgi:hypothetical protein
MPPIAKRVAAAKSEPRFGLVKDFVNAPKRALAFESEERIFKPSHDLDVVNTTRAMENPSQRCAFGSHPE